MKVANINGVDYLCEGVEDGAITEAMQTRLDRGKVTMSGVVNYTKEKNLGALIAKQTFGNAVFSFRELEAMEAGLLAMAQTAMAEAKRSALAGIENARMSDLLGES